LGFFVYGLIRRISSAIETISYKNKIIFNTVWEDPRLDIEALNITEDDTILTISSAGCNALCLLLQNPKQIYLVDRNPCQHALVELKIAAIKNLDFEEFWKMFGEGCLPYFSTKYYPKLRHDLSPESQKFWDSKAFYFDGTGMKRSFYWRGTCGTVAWLISWYINLVPGLHSAVQAIFNAKTVQEQSEIYHKQVSHKLWNRVVDKLVKSELQMSWMGIPLPQQHLIASSTGSAESVGRWVQRQIEIVWAELPMKDNYFYKVYVNGKYTRDCCPDYLKEENFAKLKATVGKISVSWCTITEFLQRNPEKKISTYILLDHMDWMAGQPEVLAEEWTEILRNATKNPKFLWRSAASNSDFVLNTKVSFEGETKPLRNVLEMNEELAGRLHPLYRVHTYTSLHIASLQGR